MSDDGIKTKDRVRDHGEVFTQDREVNAMLDLVKQETERIDSKFLEPACGDGNFLAEILRRKLKIVTDRYKRSPLDYERNSIVAIGSIYGIELLPDNRERCIERMTDIYIDYYRANYKKHPKDELLKSVTHILEKNIALGDALTMKNPSSNMPIVFSEWSRPFNDSRIKQRDYYFHELTPKTDYDLFTQQVIKDDGTEGFIPRSIKEWPLIHFLKLGERDA